MINYGKPRYYIGAALCYKIVINCVSGSECDTFWVDTDIFKLRDALAARFYRLIIL